MDMFMQHVSGTSSGRRASSSTSRSGSTRSSASCWRRSPASGPMTRPMVERIAGLVKEKVEAQVERAAWMRPRSAASIARLHDATLDEADTDVARALLGKKKKKPKAAASTARAGSRCWPSGLCLLALGYAVLPRVSAGAESGELYRARPGTAQVADSPERQGRQTIDEFLPTSTRTCPRGDMQKLADQYDRDETDKQMQQSPRRIKAEDEARSWRARPGCRRHRQAHRRGSLWEQLPSSPRERIARNVPGAWSPRNTSTNCGTQRELPGPAKESCKQEYLAETKAEHGPGGRPQGTDQPGAVGLERPEDPAEGRRRQSPLVLLAARSIAS